MSKSAQLPRIRSKARPASQRPQLVERELERAQIRLRTVDTIYSLCLLFGGVLVYLLIIIGLDYWLHLQDGVRQMLWAVAGIGALAFIGWKIVYPLVQHINPYYTARMIEKATPGSKNGIINWLDLRNEKINPIVRDSLSRRAVHELDSANMEEAIPTRKPIRTGIILGVILLAIIFVAFVLPDQIGSLFKRALFPFKSTIIPTHTRLEVLKPVEEPVPEEDVSTLPIREVMVERGQPVEFRVLTHGKIPEEVVMESQAAGDKQPMVKPLRQDKSGDSSQPWRVALSSSDIPVDGFVFWFRANDGMTRKFKLVVVSRVPPSVSDLEVKLNYPAYTKRRPTIQGMGPIRAIQDTMVDLEVTADRPAASGELEVIVEQLEDDGRFSAKRVQTIKLVRPANKSDDNKLALAEPLRLIPGYVSKDDKKQKYFYQLALVSPENLTGLSPKYPLEVTSNLAPRVEIHKIKDVTLAKDQNELEVEANAVLPVAGMAHDDIAVGQVSFKLKTSDGRDLYFVGKAPIEKNLQKANGFTSPQVPYLLTLDLSKLTYDNQSENAKPIQLKPGTIVEMVVEAADTSEPVALVGVSQLIRLKLKGEANEEQRNEQQKQADKQKQQHDQQKKEKEQQQPENNQQEKNEEQKGDKGENNDKQSGDKQTGDQGEKNEKGDKQSGEKSDKQNNEKGDKQSGDKSDKQSGDKGDTNEKQGEKGDKQSGDKNEKGDKQNNDKQGSEKGDKQSNEKGDKSDNQSGNKGDKQANEKSNNQTGEKTDKESGDKRDMNEKQNEKGDKQSGNKNEKGDKQGSDKQGSEKGDKQANEKGDKQTGEQSSEKQSGDKNEKGDKQSGDKSEKQSGDKGDMNEKQGEKNEKQSGDKNEKGDKQGSEKQGSEKGDKQANEKGDKQTGEQSSEKQSGDKNEKGDKQSGDKGDMNEKQGEKNEKQSGDKNEKGDKQANKKGDKQTGEQSSEKQSGDKNEKGEKQSGDKGDMNEKQGEKNEKQSGDKNEKGDKQASEKQGSEKGDKQANEKGDKQTSEQSSEKQSGDKNEKGDKQSNEKGDTQAGDKQGSEKGDKGDMNEKQGEKSGDKPSEKTTKDKGMAGSGQGNDPQDKGDLSKILEQVSKDNRAPEKSNFNAKPAAAKDDQKGQEVDQEAARKRELALDSLAEKLKRGDIDRKLADKMKELNLTKEEALKMVQNQQLQRVRSTGKQSDQGPGKTLTSGRRTSEQVIDPAIDVPDELSSSYQRFTEKRNQPKR